MKDVAFYYPDEKDKLLELIYLKRAFKSDDGNYDMKYLNWSRVRVNCTDCLKIYTSFYNRNALNRWLPIFISKRLQQPMFDESFVEVFKINGQNDSPSLQINASITTL